MQQRSFRTTGGVEGIVGNYVNDMLICQAREEIVEFVAKVSGVEYMYALNTLRFPDWTGEVLELQLDEGTLPFFMASFRIEGVVNNRLVGSVTSTARAVREVYDHWLKTDIIEEEAVLSMIEDGPYENVASIEVTEDDEVIVWVVSGPEDSLNMSHEQQVAKLTS